MCDVCRSEDEDWAFRNGERKKLNSVKLYRVYQGREASAQMCHLHAIELFTTGETRFLRAHLSFARFLATRSQRFEEEQSDYGFGAY